MKNTIFAMAFMLYGGSLYADDPIQVKGHISSRLVPEGIEGAKIYLNDSIINASSDINGNFIIHVPNKEAIIKVKKEGHEDKILKVGRRDSIHVRMKLSTTSKQLETDKQKIKIIGRVFGVGYMDKPQNKVKVISEDGLFKTYTDRNGYFVLYVFPSTKKLIFENFGFENKIVRIKNKSSIVVKMIPSS